MHLNRITCCSHTFTSRDIQSRLMSQKQALGTNDPNFYGGNVTTFAEAECPECKTPYLLWMRPDGQTYKVITMSSMEPQESIEAPDDDQDIPPDFNAMNKSQLREFLDKHEIQYTPQSGEERLRELAKAFV